MHKRKGTRAERGLANWLEDRKFWYAQRVGASGGGTKRPRPDIIAAKADRQHVESLSQAAAHVAVIEVKAWGGGIGHLDAAEVEGLIDVADRAGAVPLLAVKPDLCRHDQWHIFDARALHETPHGNYSVRMEDLPGRTWEEVFW